MTATLHDFRELDPRSRVTPRLQVLKAAPAWVLYLNQNDSTFELFITQHALKELLREIEAQLDQAIDDEAERVSDSHLYGRKDTGA